MAVSASRSGVSGGHETGSRRTTEASGLYMDCASMRVADLSEPVSIIAAA
jgi:hypothetical protein